jgi:hypothetical protein
MGYQTQNELQYLAWAVMLRPGSKTQNERQAGGEGRAAPVIGHEGFAQTFFLF